MTDCEKILQIITDSFAVCEKQSEADITLTTSYLIDQYLMNTDSDENLLKELPPMMLAKGYKMFFEKDVASPALEWAFKYKNEATS